MRRLAGDLLRRKHLPAILGLAGTYYLTALLGLDLALPGTNVTAVWVPSGIALAALLLGGSALWPGVTLGAFAANLHVLTVSGSGTLSQVLPAATMIGVGNTLEALLGRFLLVRSLGRTAALERSHDPLILAVIAAMSSAVAAAIGVAAIIAVGLTEGQLAGDALLTWWLGDLTGIIVITPLVLAARSSPVIKSDRGLLLQVAYLAGVGLAALMLFAGGIPAGIAQSYLILPLILVPAIWGGPLLTQLSVALIAAIAIHGTVHGHGPFQLPSLHDNLLLVQGFACVLALGGSTLAAAIAERKRREEALRRAYRHLQVLTRCNAAVVHAKDEQQLLQEVCRVAVDTAGYQLACVGFAEHDEGQTVRPVAYAGPAERYLGRMRVSWGDNEFGQGVVGSAIRTGRPSVVQDLALSPEYNAWRALVAESGFRSSAAVPLRARDTVYGAIAFYTSEPHAFGPPELDLLAELGTNLAHGMLTLRTQKQREQAQEEVVRRNKELATLADVFRATTAEVDLRALLNESLRGALELTGLEGGTLCLLADGGCLSLRASINASPQMVSELSTGDIKVGDCLCGNVARTGEPFVLRDDVSAGALVTREAVRREGIRFHAAFPLKSRQRVLGVLCVFSKTDYKPDQRQIDLLQDTCGPLALAIDNALLYEQVQRHAAELEQRVQQRTKQLEEEMAHRESAQASLRESERKYRELVENANSIILRMDTQGRIKFLNEYGQRFFGFREEELLGRSIMGTIVPPKESSGRNLKQLMQDTVIHPDRHTANENENIRRDGTRVWISWTNRPVLDERGQLVETLSVGNDITALKQTEAELEKAKEAAEAADRLKSAFLATMSHELRTPLNSIIGFTGILLQELPGPLNPEQRSQLSMVRNAARHLLALINDVLDISKIEARQLAIQRAPFSLPTLIGRVMQTMLPQAQNKKLRLVSDIAPDVQGFNGDQRRVEQVLLNLLSNAIKFTEQGQVAVCCTREPGWMVISVRDTGCGIAEQDRKTLFRPFRQLDTGLARKHEGTGLGLAICKRLVELMGGRIELESEVGRGSVFTVRLPEQSSKPEARASEVAVPQS